MKVESAGLQEPQSDLQKVNRKLNRKLEKMESRLVYSEKLLDQTQNLLNTRITEIETTRAEIKLRSEELEESEKRFKQLANSTFEGIMILNSGMILDANGLAAEMHGYEMGELLNKNVFELICEQYHEITLRRLKQEISEPYESDHVKKDGATFPAESRIKEIEHKGKRRNVIVIRDITHQKALKEELKTLARTDPLTGVNNRRHFMELAELEFCRSKRYGHPVSVMMMDLDYFKQINDSFGHSAGDKTLKSITQVCLSTLRDVDLFGRLGGEEFGCVMPETGTEAAMYAAERIRQKIGEIKLKLDRDTITLTISIGVASMEASDTDIEMMLRKADEALYAAKAAGRNRSSFSPQKL